MDRSTIHYLVFTQFIVHVRTQNTYSGTDTRTLKNDFFAISAAMALGPLALVHRIAKPALALMVPILLYSAVVPGGWDGFASDFDATRVQAIRYHYANAYALEHMSPRGLFRTCQDEQIELTDDAKAVCGRALNVGPGERIPGQRT
jgi:hypothetical protein